MGHTAVGSGITRLRTTTDPMGGDVAADSDGGGHVHATLHHVAGGTRGSGVGLAVRAHVPLVGHPQPCDA
eukprot:75146-Pyramimonas_sp.AAC.2